MPGYEHNPDDRKQREAFQRKFERDKAELRRLGFPVQTGTDPYQDESEPGYRLARDEFELPELEFTAPEAAAVATAINLWQQPQLRETGHGALRKLKAAGIHVGLNGTHGRVQPRLSDDTNLVTLLEAATDHRQVIFDYHSRGNAEAARRRLQPWGSAAWKGRWYVAGWDLDRRARRCFKLSRIVGEVRAVGNESSFEPPADVDVLSFIAQAAEPAAPTRLAEVVVRPQTAWALRRLAIKVGPRTAEGDVLAFEFSDTETTAAMLASFGPDVTVREPQDLVKATVYCLQRIAGEEIV